MYNLFIYAKQKVLLSNIFFLLKQLYEIGPWTLGRKMWAFTINHKLMTPPRIYVIWMQDITKNIYFKKCEEKKNRN